MNQRRNEDELSSEDVFHFFTGIFSFILDKLKPEDSKILESIIMLSLTFYYVKGEIKIYIQEEIKKKKNFSKKISLGKIVKLYNWKFS